MSASPDEGGGFAFHREREELHGITVLVTASDGRRYVGRYHERNARGVLMKDVAIHAPDDPAPWEVWLAKQKKFGVAVSEKVCLVPGDDVQSVRRLTEV